MVNTLSDANESHNSECSNALSRCWLFSRRNGTHYLSTIIQTLTISILSNWDNEKYYEVIAVGNPIQLHDTDKQFLGAKLPYRACIALTAAKEWN